MHGVSIMLLSLTENCLSGFYSVSVKNLLVMLKRKPFDVCIIQVFATTCVYRDEDVDLIHEDVIKAKRQCEDMI